MTTVGMTTSGVALPLRFRRGKTEITVTEVLDQWIETGPMKGGDSSSAERYLRKHWWLIRTTDGQEMKIYMERQPRSRREIKKRWWLYSITVPAPPA
jgi:hypothetical protein